MALTIHDLLTPEMVREIAEIANRNHVCVDPYYAAKNAIELAAPEIAAAALEWAADNLWSVGYGPDPSERLRQMSKEITNAD